MSFFQYFSYLNFHTIVTLICLVFVIIIWFLIYLWNNYPVNCWFCNTNSRVLFKSKNAWFCQHCHQYNGFTSDGDYNKPLYQHMQPCNKVMYNYNKFPPRQPTNGLCHKCNTNQHLKVIQLANFKPLNENKFDKEVEQFVLHLEQVYKLCKKCKRHVNNKLQSEKGAFLNPRKSFHKNVKNKTQYINIIGNFLKRISFGLAFIFFCASLLFICLNANLFFSKKIIRALNQHQSNLLNYTNSVFTESFFSVVNKHKTKFLNIPAIDNAINVLSEYISYSGLTNLMATQGIQMTALEMAVETLIILGLLFQVLVFLLESGKSIKIFINIFLWIVSFYLKWTEDRSLYIFQPMLACLLMWISSSIANKSHTNHLKNSGKGWKKIKNLSNSPTNSNASDNELFSEDSDFEDPAVDRNRTSTPEHMFDNQSYHFSDNRSQICRPYGFHVNSMCNQSGVGYDTIRSQGSPTSCTTELDRGIGTLSLETGSNWGGERCQHNISSPHYYNIQSPPSAYSPSHRPIISPSRFVYSTQQSWVAGGYWGPESPKKAQHSHNTSRSSSQSSGFESIVSSNPNKNSFVPVYHNKYFKSLTTNKPEGLCDTSVHSNLLFRSNVFRNVTEPNTSASSLMNSTLRSDNYSPRVQSLNLFKENSFIAPNPNSSFIPVDKPK